MERSSSSPAVFIISLDGATFDVLRPLAAQGYMPNLARMLESGLSAELESVVPPVTAPAWSSFMTGKTPNHHGIFDFMRFDPLEYRAKLNNSAHIRSKTLWQILSSYGKRVVVLHLPYLYPVYEINGVMVAGWDAPTGQPFTFPADLAEEVYKVIPDYGAALDLSLWNYLPTESEREFDGFLEKLVLSCKQTATLAGHLLNTQPWDVFMVHFQQTDWIQHKLWAYIERACTNGNDTSERVQKVRLCYQAFDEYVGKLLVQVEDVDPIRIILSDHGFGANRGTIRPNYAMRQLGHYRLKTRAENQLQLKQSRNRLVRNLYQGLRSARAKLRGKNALKTYKNWADMVNNTVDEERAPVDWSKTKAAFVGGCEVGFIFVNVKGRGPLGCVDPGGEYETLINRLIRECSSLTGPDGQRVLASVKRGHEVYPTECAAGVLLPDLVLTPSEGYVVAGGTLDLLTSDGGDGGNHRSNGVLLVQGPGVGCDVPNFRPQLIDLAPTILHAEGLPVPRDMDGRVLEEIFSKSSPIRFEDVDNSRAVLANEHASDEGDLIEQRLRGLGYVE